MVKLDTGNNLEAMKVEKIVYLTFLHKILCHSIQLICMTLSHIVFCQMVQYLLSYIWFNMPAHWVIMLLLPCLSAQKLYHYICLIYMTISHIILSRMAQYLLNYIQFTLPAHPIHQNCPFWEKYSHHYRPLITCNPYPSKPVPRCAGAGKLGLGYR